MELWFDSRSEDLPDTLRGKLIYMKHDSLFRLQPDTQLLKLGWRAPVKKKKKRRKKKKRGRPSGTQSVQSPRSGRNDAQSREKHRFRIRLSADGSRQRGHVVAETRGRRPDDAGRADFPAGYPETPEMDSRGPVGSRSEIPAAYPGRRIQEHQRREQRYAAIRVYDRIARKVRHAGAEYPG